MCISHEDNACDTGTGWTIHAMCATVSFSHAETCQGGGFPGCHLAYTLIEEYRFMATATLDWSQCPAVESIPGKVGGAWVFRGTSRFDSV